MVGRSEPWSWTCGGATVAGMIAGALMALASAAASTAGPDGPPVNPFLTYTDPQSWTARVQVDVTAYESSDVNRVQVHAWNIETLAMIFPIMRETAASAGDPADITSEFRVADRAYSTRFKLIDGYHSGAAFARWDARELSNVRDVSVVFAPSVRSWETTLNEKAAAAVGWPKGDWPTAARSTFEPQFGVEYTHEVAASHQVVDGLLKRWTEGRDPKSIPPLQLAKYLAGRVLEQVQPSGSGLSGGRTSRRRGFEGFDLLGAERTLSSGRGTPFDMAAALAGVYRRAGLPARIVIGLRQYDPFDTDDVASERELVSEAGLHAYVEFFLFDEVTGAQGWLPVDIVHLRRNGSRARPLEQPWPFFGTHDELDYFIPLSFHFHPPTTVRAYGSPAMWGWFVTPAPPEAAFQQLTFASHNTPVRGGDRKDEGRD